MKFLFSAMIAVSVVSEPLFAQTADAAAPELGGFGSMFPLFMIVVLAYFLLIKPQMKQQRAHEEAVASVKRNEKVILGSGIEGVVTKVDDANKRLTVRIAEGVEIKVVQDGTSIRTILDRKPANDDAAAKTAGKKKTAADKASDKAAGTKAADKKTAKKKPAAKKTSK